MLVLSRKENECVMIGDIPVYVVKIRGEKVRLGIEAPKHVPVHRREVYDAIARDERQKKQASLHNANPVASTNPYVWRI